MKSNESEPVTPDPPRPPGAPETPDLDIERILAADDPRKVPADQDVTRDPGSAEPSG
jgi:hypothetical protein